MSEPIRADVALAARGLARSRAQAQQLIRAGAVRVNGLPLARASALVTSADVLDLTEPDHYVARAAHKLIGALDDSETAVPERVLDGGASTGGFTQVLLERGARRVYAIDVGHGQLAPALAGDPRITLHEGTNLRDLTVAHVDSKPVDLVVGDVSFISLRLLLAPLLSVLTSDGVALLLVKPQFEVGRGLLDARGVVRDRAARERAVEAVAADAAALGWVTTWRGPSRLPGQNGNLEFFLKMQSRRATVGDGD